MSQTINNYNSIFEDTLHYDHEGVIKTDTWIKALDNDDFHMYHDPLRMLDEDGCPYRIEKARVDGMLESIVNQATATNAYFDTQKVPQNMQKYDDNAIDGFEYLSSVVPTTTDNRNAITTSMDAYVPCFNNNCGSAYDPLKTNLEMILDYNDTWVTNMDKEEGSQLVIHPQGDGQVNEKFVCGENVQVLPQWSPEGDVDQMVLVQEKDDEVVPPQYTNEKGLFTGDSEDACNGSNKNSEMSVNMSTLPLTCQTRTGSGRRSLEPKRGSTSRNLSSSKKGKGMKAAASRKHNKSAHNKSEQTRRNVINRKMKTLHELVPRNCKTVKASKELILTEVIQYVKGLQAQIQSTVPCVAMYYPMTTNTWQMNNMYPMMAHPLMNTTVMDINCINTHIAASTSSPAVFIHPTIAFSPYVPESHEAQALPLSTVNKCD